MNNREDEDDILVARANELLVRLALMEKRQALEADWEDESNNRVKDGH